MNWDNLISLIFWVTLIHKGLSFDSPHTKIVISKLVSQAKTAVNNVLSALLGEHFPSSHYPSLCITMASRISCFFYLVKVKVNDDDGVVLRVE